MASSTARASTSATPLRRRSHILSSKRAASSNGSTTVRAEDEQDTEVLPSPPTSFVGENDDDDSDGEQYADDEDEANTARDFVPEAEPDIDDEEPEAYDRRPWYRPSLPVVLALAPALGNWLTGGDHLKDLLLLVLLVFYLHQLVELPWTLYHNARPRRSLHPVPITSSQARSELHRLELFLLLVCLVTPALGVVLLRSLTSTAPYNSSSQRQPISWFSTSLFALLTAFRPLRELVSLITTRTSTLHTRIHTGPVDADQTNELTALRAEVALLSSRLDALAQNPPRRQSMSLSSPQLVLITNRIDALTTLVSSHSELLPLLEDGVHRLERRVGRLRAGKKAQQAQAQAQPAGTTANTIFVSAPPTRTHLLSWLMPSPAPAPVPVPVPLIQAPGPPPPLSPSSLKTRAPLGLASIPEEGEAMPAAYPITPRMPKQSRKSYRDYQPQTQKQSGLWELLTKLALTPLQLLLLPLYIALLPLRSVLRLLVN